MVFILPWEGVVGYTVTDDVGLLDPSGMITATVKLEDVVEKGFKALLEERDRHCKILVDMQAG